MSGKSYKQKHVSKKEQKITPSSSSGKGKQSKNNTEELKNEIEKLKRTIVIYRNNLDPALIRAELDLRDQTLINILTDENLRLTEELHKYNSTDTRERLTEELHKYNSTDTRESAKTRKEVDLADQSMINILMDENLRLTEELQKYTSSYTIESPSAQKATDTKKQSNVDRGNENKKESQQKQREIDVLGVNGKVKTLQNEISHANSETEKQINLKGQQVEQNANNNANKRSNHNEVLQQKATEIDALKEEVKELSRKLTEFKDIKTELQNAKKSVEKKENTIQEMIKEKTKIENEKNELENECESIREQLKISERQLEGLKKNSSNSDESAKSQQADEIMQKLKEINELKNDLTEVQSKNNNLKAEKDNLDSKLRQSANQVTAKEHEIKTLKEEHGKMLEIKDKKLRQSMEQIKAKEHEIKTLREEHEQTIKKKDDLSKFVDANIMKDNPNITDLSDENRPTKLSEKHCELYDNEWTDAYEEAENEFKTEEKGIAHLYKTLQDVSDFCKKKSVEHEENIRNSIMTLPNLPSARPKSAKIGAINQHQLKEVRKSFAPMLVESVFQNYVHEKKLNFTKKENIGRFIKKCVEICWLMNSQNPPVIFDTSDVDGKSFDVDKFRTYTKTGKLVDYVVWPPMLLHKGGPMICKGVAQGK